MDDAGQWGVSRTFTSEQIRRRQVQYIHNAGTGSNHLNVDIEELELTASDQRGNTGLKFNYTIFIHPRDDEPPKCNLVQGSAILDHSDFLDWLMSPFLF